jgi:MoxR-like ATPase
MAGARKVTPSGSTPAADADGMAIDQSQVFGASGPEGPDSGLDESPDELGRRLVGDRGPRKLRDIELAPMPGNDLIPNILTEGMAPMAAAMAMANKGVMFHGAPGIGKTAIATTLGGDPDLVDWSNQQSGLHLKALKVVTLSAPELNPEDLMGVPTIKEVVRRFEKENRSETCRVTVWATPTMLDPTEPFILFIDEPNRCEPAVRNALFQLVTGNTTSSGFKMPPGSVVIAAGNRAEDKAGTRSMDNAWTNRFAHMNVSVSVPAWLDWAQENGLSPVVRAFIKRNPSYLSEKFDASDPSPAKPTPRSWEGVGRIYADKGNSNILKTIAAEGLIGKPGAQLLKAFAKHEEAIPDPDVLKKNPDSIKIPAANDMDTAWAMSMALADQMVRAPGPGMHVFQDPLALGIAHVLKKFVQVHPEAAMYSLEAARRSLKAAADKAAQDKGSQKPGGFGATVFLGVASALGKDERFKKLFQAIIGAGAS